MLKKHMNQFISNTLTSTNQIGEVTFTLYKEEKEYALEHHLIPENVNVAFIEKNPNERFTSAYIERIDKESEEVIAVEKYSFLHNTIEYLKNHKNEFIYLETENLEMIDVDAISFEVDDVFGTYDVMLGLKLPKKYDACLKATLQNNLHGENVKLALLFNHDDGLWDLNFALNNVDGFKEDMKLDEAFCLIYIFIFKIIEKVEETYGKE